MLENGFIKLYRSVLAWEWYTETNTKAVFLHLLLTANYEDKKYRGTAVRRGERVCSLATLAKETNLSLQNVRTAINHLIKTGEVTHSKFRECGVFKLNNYDKFQSPTDEATSAQQTPNSPPTQGQQSPNIPLTSMEEVKKDNKANKAKRQEGGAGAQTPAPAGKNTYGEFNGVQLSDNEHEKLLQRLGKENATDYIARLDGWLAEGNTKKNHYATIINWWRKDGEGKAQTPKQGWKQKDKNAGMIATSYNISELDKKLIDNFLRDYSLIDEVGNG